MMAVLELYGKCKELGSCDCEGFFGCHDPKPPAPKPVIENELANAMKAEREVSDYSNHNYRRELEAIEQSEGLVECEVCHRSHLSSHPHITNIEGDVPIDDAEPVQRKSSPVISLPPPDDQLPGWLREKQAGEAGQPGDLDQAEQLCKLCGKPWAPRHDCNPAETTVSKKRVTPYHMRQIAKCDICGKKKQSNHKCKGRPDAEAVRAAGGCEDCERAGELCVRHGGVWSDYDIAKVETRPTDDRVAKTLPAPISVTESETKEMCRNGHLRTPENAYIRSDGRRECKECKRSYRKDARPALPAEADRELVAIGTILKAVEGLESKQLKRVMDYVAVRLEEAE